MPEIVDEQVAVWISPTGIPRRFEWNGHAYVICGKPVPWVDSAPWWTLKGENPPGDDFSEQAMWTVHAMRSDSGETIRADLAVARGDWWRLTRVGE